MNNVLLYAVTVLVWGSTWFAIEFQLGDVPPEVSVFYRYAAASLVLFGWCVLRRLPLRYPPAAQLRFASLGALLFCLNYLCTYYAQEHITSALSAIAFSTMLWMNIVNSRLFFGIRSDRRVIVGSIAGIAGIVVLFYPQIDALSWTDATLYGATLSMSGALIASLGNMVSQSAQKANLPIVQSNAFGMLYGAAMTGLIAWVQGRPFVFELTTGYIVSLAYLVVFGSIVAFGAYLTLLGRIGPHKAGYAVVMFPVVALLFSVAFEGLALTANIVVGVMLVLAGNLVILRKSSRKTADPVDPNRLGTAEA